MQADASVSISQSRRRKMLFKCVFEVKHFKYTLFAAILLKSVATGGREALGATGLREVRVVEARRS